MVIPLEHPSCGCREGIHARGAPRRFKGQSTPPSARLLSKQTSNSSGKSTSETSPPKFRGDETLIGMPLPREARNTAVCTRVLCLQERGSATRGPPSASKAEADDPLQRGVQRSLGFAGCRLAKSPDPPPWSTRGPRPCDANRRSLRWKSKQWIRRGGAPKPSFRDASTRHGLAANFDDL